MAATKSTVVGTAAYRGGSLREDLANFISNISRDETPYLSGLGSVSVKGPRHEWQVDTLAAPSPTGQIDEGFTFNTSNAADITTTRLSNYTEARAKTVDVAGALIRSDAAGAANWFAYSMKKRGRELKRDFEAKAVNYQASTVDATVVYSAASTRNMGSYAAYAANWVRAANTTVELNGSSGTGTAITTTQGGAFNVWGTTNAAQGSHVVQYTAAPTNVTLTLDHITNLLEGMYTNGGRPNTVQVPAGLKGTVSKLLIDGNGGAAQRRASEMSKKVNLAVDSVMAEFGFELAIVPNYVMDAHANSASSSVYIYDADMIKEGVLTPITVEEDGTARYGKAAIMFCEKTVEFRNPNSMGVITGVQAS